MRFSALLLSLVLLDPPSALAGAWGAGPFDNDDALDWAHEFARHGSVGTLSSQLSRALWAKYLEAPAGSSAIAAAEVVAALAGQPHPSLPPQLSAWVSDQRQKPIPFAQLLDTARSLVMRVADADTSELAQLWAEGNSAEWLSHLADLRGRLKAIVVAPPNS